MATLTQIWTQIHGEVKKVAVSFDKNLHRAEVNFENACYSIRQSPLILLCPPASVDGGMPPVKVFPEARHHAVAEDVLDEAPHRQRLGPAKHQPQVRLPPRQVRRVVPSVRTIELFYVSADQDNLQNRYADYWHFADILQILILSADVVHICT